MHFSFRLGARRALDFADFFDANHAQLATEKRLQAELFGQCHMHATAENWKALADSLVALAEIEDRFRENLLKIQAR